VAVYLISRTYLFVLVLFTLWRPELNDSSTTKETKEANEAHGPPPTLPFQWRVPRPSPPSDKHAAI
jgi:hypothetical protein